MKNNKRKQQLVEELKKRPIVELACTKTGTSRASFYRWKQEDPTFAKAVDEALGEGVLLMNDLAEAQLLSAVKDRNLGAIIFWLKHHHPAYTTQLELGGKITHLHGQLTPEEEELVKEALRLALPQPQGSSPVENHGQEP